jgi:hypothetical protein
MILIVGSNCGTTASYYKKIGLKESILFTGEFNSAEVYHTSIADCNTLSIHLNHFDQVIWAESSINEFNNYQEYFDTLTLIRNHAKDRGIISRVNQDPYNIKPPRLSISNTKNSAIFLGCSHTAGFGLPDISQSFTHLVSKNFNKSLINLGAEGLGNFKSFEKINQIDFFKNQIVVLQLTDIARMQMFFDDSHASMVYSQLYKIKDPAYIKVFNDKQLLHMMLDRLDLVVKYSRSLKLHLVIFNLGGNPNFNHDTEHNFLRQTTEYYLQDYPEYIPAVLEKNIDRGTDGCHFGPKSQALWANLIIKKIENLYR